MKRVLNNKLWISVFVFLIYFIFILYFSSTNLTLGNFLSHLVFLILITFIYRDELKTNWKQYKSTKKSFKTILLYFAITIVITLIVSNIVINTYITITGSEQLIGSSNTTIYSMFDQIPWGTLFVLFLTVLFYPIVEELIFRKSLGDVIKNKFLFIMISSLLAWYFQVTILSPSANEFVLAIGTLFYSIFAAFVYSKKKNILYTIFPRMLYNLLICIVQFVYLFK